MHSGHLTNENFVDDFKYGTSSSLDAVPFDFFEFIFLEFIETKNGRRFLVMS